MHVFECNENGEHKHVKLFSFSKTKSRERPVKSDVIPDINLPTSRYQKEVENKGKLDILLFFRNTMHYYMYKPPFLFFCVWCGGKLLNLYRSKWK